MSDEKSRTFGEILEVTFYSDKHRYDGDPATLVGLGGTYEGKIVHGISVDHTPGGYPTVTFYHPSTVTILPGVKLVEYCQEFRV